MVNIRMQNSTSPSSSPSTPEAQTPSSGSPQMSSPPTQQMAGGGPRIFVVSCGGAGGNAVNNMIEGGQQGCEYLVCNSDAQALENSNAKMKVQLGPTVTGGLGAGSKPDIGRAAAEESLDDVMQHLQDVNMVFITAGMGGGTGTGSAPVIAKACRERGILTVGVVTKPFHFEGSHRMKTAEAGIEEMQDYVDTLIVIPNQNLFRVANEKTTFAEAFEMADSVLKSGVSGVIDLMVKPGLVNLDFADIRTAMLEMGKAMMGTGEAQGEKRATEAAEAAINNPLLDDVSMKGANGVIINVTGGYDMTLFEADEACNRIRDEVDPSANIIFGATFDEKLEGTMRVSIVATGIEKEAMRNYTGSSAGGTIERAQPKTADTQTSAVAPQPKTEVPTMVAEPMATSLEDSQEDIFEQSSLGGASQAETLPQNTALRGTRMNDSFIPPKPADGHDMAAEGASMTAPVSASPVAVAATPPSSVVPQAIKPVGSSLKLNPPKLPTSSDKKTSPSFFERISGAVQSKIEGVLEDLEKEGEQKEMGIATTGESASRVAGGGSSPVAQGALNIDAPAAKPKQQENSELDIPAFLRRQAN